MFWDRRKGDRRAGKDRSGDEIPDRDRRDARGADRRQWRYGILYKTSLPIREIEQWLEANAIGRWSVGLEGMDESLSSKVLKIMFENQDDKSDFIDFFSRR